MIIRSGYQDSNLGPPAPKAGALTGLRYIPKYIMRRGGDSNPRYSYPYVSLANWWFQPLTHLSKSEYRCQILIRFSAILLKLIPQYFF